jgi:transcriptional regulator with XRE-family HTH domain
MWEITGGMVLGEIVAKNVKALRLQRGLSQKELGEKTGLTIRYISRLENTAPNLTLEVIEKLTVGLSCSPIDLVGNENNNQAMTDTRKLLDQTIQFLQGLRSRI